MPSKTTRPSSSSTTRSARRSASGRSAVSSTTLISSAVWAITDSMLSRPAGSRPAIGSSRTRCPGFIASRPARATRRRSPPLSEKGERLANAPAVEPDAAHGLLHPLLAGLLVQPGLHRAEADILADRDAEELVIRLLHQQAHPPPGDGQALQLRHILPVERHRADARAKQAVQHATQGALSPNQMGPRPPGSRGRQSGDRSGAATDRPRRPDSGRSGPLSVRDTAGPPVRAPIARRGRPATRRCASASARSCKGGRLRFQPGNRFGFGEEGGTACRGRRSARRRAPPPDRRSAPRPCDG